MRLDDTTEQVQLRQQLRDWLPEAIAALPLQPPSHDLAARRHYDLAWQSAVHTAGFAGIDWPTAFGGRGLSEAEQLIYLKETARAGAPAPGVNLVGLMHAGPTIIAMGHPELQKALVPDILSGRTVWCQGFSEPGAGSDLAAIQTKARRVGDEYVITGQKIWSTNAQVANWCEMVVRTDPESRGPAGLTWLAVPMDSPGIDVRPIRTIDGRADFCEMFLDEVRCPVAHRVSDEGSGWGVAMATLTHERLLAFTADLVHASQIIELLATLEYRERGTKPSAELGLLTAQLASCWALLYRNVSSSAYGTAPKFGVSTFKLAFSETANHIGDLAVRVATGEISTNISAVAAADLLESRLWYFALTIAGGTSQIQRNIISERILGLPKDKRES